MQKKIMKYLCVFMVIALAAMTGIIFLIQTNSAQKQQGENGVEKLNTIQEKMEQNEVRVQELTEEFGQDALVKAKILVRLISDNPKIIETTESMQKTADLLDVNEVHVIDEKGFLQWGNVPDYYGLDFASGEQTKPFLSILEDPSIEIVQEPQQNAASGIYFQYIAVARQDKKGVIQIGYEPTELSDALKNNTIDKVLEDVEYGQSGYAFAVEKETGSIAAFPNKELIGSAYEDAGIAESLVTEENRRGIYKVNGGQVYCVTMNYGGYVMGVAMPVDELYANRMNQVFSFALMCLAVFLVLLGAINFLIKRQVLNGIGRIIDGLQSITGGNLEEVIDVRNNKEFGVLSDNINEMVGSIKGNLKESIQRAEENEKLMEEQKQLFNEIRSFSREIATSSQKTLDVSRQIKEGTEEQAGAVEQILNNMSALMDKSKESAGVSREASDDAQNSAENMTQASEKMELMVEAMREISDSADKIKDIIQDIDSIASSTNMLSLNASIEAARAGEQGKGFAVVAGQVGELAKQSAEAARQTGILIQGALTAIEKGEKMAIEAKTEFEEIIVTTKESADVMMGLATVSLEQASMVEQATAGIHHISEVVENNTDISKQSEAASEELADQSQKLTELVI